MKIVRHKETGERQCVRSTDGLGPEWEVVRDRARAPEGEVALDQDNLWRPNEERRTEARYEQLSKRELGQRIEALEERVARLEQQMGAQ